MHNDFKQHFDKIKKENSTLQAQNADLIAEKKRWEAEISSQKKHFVNLLDQRQKTLEELQLRTSSPIGEPDLLKAKMNRFVETPYKQKIDSLNLELEEKDGQISELERQNEFLKKDLENIKTEYEKAIKEMKNKYISQIDSLNFEIHALQNNSDERKDKELMRLIKNDLDETKRKYAEAQKDLLETKNNFTNLQGELELLNQENARLTQENQEINTNAQNEINKITEKFKESEIEHSSEIEKSLSQNKQIQQLLIENEQLKGTVQELEIENGQLKKQIEELGNSLKDRENDIDNCILQIQEENKENARKVNDEKQFLQNEIDRLEQKLREEQENNTQELEEMQKKIENSERAAGTENQEKSQLRSRIEELEEMHKNLKNNYDKLAKQNENLEDELFSTQTRYRGSLTKEQELSNLKEHLEISIKLLKEEHQTLLNEKNDWATERSDLQNQILKLTKKLEDVTKEASENIQKHMKKASEYKAKVRQANLKLQNMSSKLLHGNQAESFQQGVTPIKGEVMNIKSFDVKNYATVLDKGIENEIDEEKLEADIEKTLEKHMEY